MAYSLFLDPQGLYLELCLSGDLTLSDMAGIRDQASTVCRQQHIHKLLVDARLVHANLTALDLYNLATDLAGRASLPGMYYAIVVGKDSPQLNLFGQLARRRGIRLDAYFAYDEALDQLLSTGST